MIRTLLLGLALATAATAALADDDGVTCASICGNSNVGQAGFVMDVQIVNLCKICRPGQHIVCTSTQPGRKPICHLQ